MTIPRRYKFFLDYFLAHQPEVSIELNYSNDFELLIAVILSAQCTDKRVNATTPALFKRFPTAKSMAESDIETIFYYIRNISYPNNKSKHLFGTASMLVNNFNGNIPSDINAIQKLPGVGRKTANIIAAVLFGQPLIAVDTHVFRVSHRLGLVPSSATSPLSVEKELTKNIPKQHRIKATQWLVLHGRYVCKARSPKCSVCPLLQQCEYQKKSTSSHG